MSEHPHAGVSYLDTAAVGLVPAPVTRAVTEVGAALALGTRGSARWHALSDPAAELLATEWGSSAERLSFVSSTGEAMNAVARALPVGRGDEILTLDGDFPQTRLPFLGLGASTVVEVPVPRGTTRTRAVLDRIGPRTRAVVVSHVHAETGDVIDLAELSEACRAVDALLIVDGAQAAGVIPVPAALCDIYTAVGYKWLTAGFGIAVAHRSERFDAACRPGLRGYPNEDPASRELRTGHENVAGLAALAAACLVRRDIGIARIEARTSALAARIATACRALEIDAAGGAGIVSIAATDAAATVAALADRGVVAAVRGGRIRLSPHHYTTDDEIDRLLDVVTDLVRSRGHFGRETP